MSSPPPLNFIHGDVDQWSDVADDAGRDLTVDELAPRIRLGREIWIVQAFQLLRQMGHNVSLSGAPIEGAINILHCDDIDTSLDLWKYFIVSVRADRDPAFVSEFEIVQNKASIWSSTDHYIPHWPQPGLLPRDAARGTRIENVVYMGKEDNLDPALRDDSFRSELARLGMNLVVKSDGWWDYRASDVVLAVRSGYPLYLAAKPASKLVNAWMAGCPAIVSPEHGYRELRESRLDYFEAETPAQVLRCLQRLVDQPDLFSQMTQRGGERASAYTAPAIAERWAEFLAGPVSQRHAQWAQETASGTARQMAYRLALLKRRIWGTQVSQEHKAGWWREALRPIRRTTMLPGSWRIGRTVPSASGE